MSHKSLAIRFLQVVFLLTFALRVSAADVNAGKTLFVNNCASCHAKSMKDKLTGPALAGVRERWGNDAQLYAWIRNSQASIAAGVPRAVQIWNEYKPVVMSNFSGLKDEEIDNLMAYIEGVSSGKIGGPPKVAGAAVKGGADEEDSSNVILYGVAFALLAALTLVLSRIMSNLNRTVAEKAGQVYVERTWADALTSSTVKGFAIFALIVLGGFTTVSNSISLGRQQNYAPDQPIKFSHKTHAGLNKIDCQYCHDGARRSKHSNIPATNTCMNCHKAIKVGSQYKTAELTKIYVSAGWDPSTDKYMEGYDNMSQDEVASVYKKWIASKYREERKIDTTAKVGSDERLFVDDQWASIAASLTNEQKDKVQGPIQWKKIHNLADHVYFNHAQHVAVGKVECASCHGAVEKMEVLKQHAPLSMGWCINCHRQTEVKFATNDFYKSYEIYHEQIKKGTREKVTVEDIGGLECQKCHY
jgi:mono/diheme cytochrome c family protein